MKRSDRAGSQARRTETEARSTQSLSLSNGEIALHQTWIDITRPIDNTLVTWPGRPAPQHRWEKRLAAGDHCNVSVWNISAHAGTHMDAPLHFVEAGKPIDQIAPDVFMGECQLIDLGADQFGDALAERYAGVKRLLLKTRHSEPQTDRVYRDHDALLTTSAVDRLVGAGLVLVGTDRLSVDDSRGANFDVHHALLGAGCVIIEGLMLGEVSSGKFFLAAAPLRLSGTEASPLRALIQALQ